MKKIKEMLRSLESSDERLRNETNKLGASMYPLTMALLVIVILLKCIVFTYAINDCYFELVALLGSVGVIAIRSLLYPVPLKKSQDEHIRSIQDRIVSHSFFGTMFYFVFGEFVLMYLLPEEQFMMIAFYIPIWFVPSAIITYKAIRNGLFVMGTKKKRKTGLQKFKRNCIIGSAFFGIFVGWDMMFTEQGFEPFGIVMVFFMALLWGFPFYFVMKLMINKSEKRADEQLTECDELHSDEVN